LKVVLSIWSSVEAVVVVIIMVEAVEPEVIEQMYLEIHLGEVDQQNQRTQLQRVHIL
tara:strand:- start:388 stop:558 length:171 start_codon:yes stop_codon:yes gene_type:complete